MKRVETNQVRSLLGAEEVLMEEHGVHRVVQSCPRKLLCPS